MAERHNRPTYFIANHNEIRSAAAPRPATQAELDTAFRFSEMVARPPLATPHTSLLRALASQMTVAAVQPDSAIPAGFTYLGQFIDHDLTRDPSKLDGNPSAGLPALSERSPALDLDSVYGRGPTDPASCRLFEADGVRLRIGTTQAAAPPPVADKDLPGFDLPRRGTAATDPADRRQADIADHRNDENLAVGQIHLAFLRVHTATVARLQAAGVPAGSLFRAARREVVLHYQWMIRHDFLPRILDAAVLNDVFTNGRRVFEVGATGTPTMPIEFSVAAYRLGHSMIRAEYDWNPFFNPRRGAFAPASLVNFFRFSGTSGNLSPFASSPPAPPNTESDINNPVDGDFDRLPSNWIVDWTRMFDFVADAALPALAPLAPATINHAHTIDTRMTDPLAQLPLGAFGARGAPPADPMMMNLAFRNLLRGHQVGLATGQEVANHFLNLGAATSTRTLTSNQILTGNGSGVDLTALSAAEQTEVTTETLLWFYILREAEMNGG